MRTDLVNPDKVKENRIRRLARRHGYVIRKSRRWRKIPNLENRGEYMLIDHHTEQNNDV
jgi:hypothetical protein